MSELIVNTNELKRRVTQFNTAAQIPWGKATKSKDLLIFIRAIVNNAKNDREKLINGLNASLSIYNTKLQELQTVNVTNADALTQKEIDDHIWLIAKCQNMINANTRAIDIEKQIISHFDSAISFHDPLSLQLFLKMVLSKNIGNFADAIAKVNKEQGDHIDRIDVDIFASLSIYNIMNNIDTVFASESDTFNRGVPLISDGVQATDIIQGAIGDCWLVSVLVGIAKQNPKAISDSICVISPGVYVVRLYTIKNMPIYVTVNESELDKYNDTEFGVRHASTASENWVAVMEAALGKASNDIFLTRRGSSIVDFDSGGSINDSQEIYMAITNDSAWDEDIKGLTAMEQYNIISNHVMKNDAMMLSALPLPEGITQPEWFFEPHAYTIVGAENGHIQLRNPWGISSPGADPNGIINITPEEFNKYFYYQIMIGEIVDE